MDPESSDTITIGTPLLDAARDRIMFIPEVGKRLRRSPNQIRWMIAQGTAPKHAKIAGRICFRESDVEKFIADAFGSDAG